MANRRMFKNQALQRELVHLYAEVAIGATGAPTLSTADSLGFTSIARAGAGDYDVVLDDNYNELVMIRGVIFDPASEDIVIQPAVRDATASGGATFSFFTNTAATATDPSNGATLLLEVVARNVKALGE